MTKPAKKSRAWIITLAAAAGIIAYVVGVLVPGQRSLAALREQTQEKKKFVSDSVLAAAASVDLEGRLERANAFVAAWRQQAPTDPHLVHFLGKLATLSDEASVRLNRLSPHEPLPMATLRQHAYSLVLEGEFTQIMDFVTRVEELPETIWIRKVNMQPSSKNARVVQCELTITVFADNREISG